MVDIKGDVIEEYAFLLYQNGNTKCIDSPIAKYDFEYHYDNSSNIADYYTGTVYAPSHSYMVGTHIPKINENNNNGYYDITNATFLTDTSEMSKNGSVYITNYFDSESGFQARTPLKAQLGIAAGNGFLGSENDYIISTGLTECFFGSGYNGTFYEADMPLPSRPRPTPRPKPRPRPPVETSMTGMGSTLETSLTALTSAPEAITSPTAALSPASSNPAPTYVPLFLISEEDKQ